MSILNKMRAKATLVLKAGGTKISNVEIEEIPKVWTKFPNSNDEWVNVDFPESENTTACIYNATEPGDFPPHFHKSSIEHFVILNRGGVVEVVTEDEIKTYCFPQSVFIEKGVKHFVRFKTPVKIFIMWHPKMAMGWNADYVED